MFLLIPAIFVFLLLTYVYLHEISLSGQILIYGFCLFIIVATFLLYRGIKKDLFQQEINKIDADIEVFKKRLKNIDDADMKKSMTQRIEQLEKEKALKLQNK